MAFGTCAKSTMRLFMGIVFCSLVIGVSSEGWYSFFKEAVQDQDAKHFLHPGRVSHALFQLTTLTKGAGDMCRAYWDLMASNHQNSDRYFYARGNYDAAQRGPGGVWAAKVISRFRDYLQVFANYYLSGDSSSVLEDLKSNQKAEEWGRSGKDPNRFRTDGLAKKY
uniref:Serum amyloid A protein n=1 Tax=Callithrix jacchus TaxID=9483 RepID=A0A5F4WA97_CALJA